MTKCQEKIYNIIKDFISENGYPPTVREIGELAGLNSPATVFTHLMNLEKEGFILTGKGKSRAIKVLK